MREHGREISSGLRAFCKEISWKIGERKISEYQGEHLSTLFEWLAQICWRETRNWIKVCLEKVVNDTWDEKKCLLLPDCWHKKVGPVVPLSKTWQLHDLLTMGSEMLPRHKRIYLSSRPWLPTITMPDHRVITTFTLVKFPLSSTAFTKVSVGVYTWKMFALVKWIWYLGKPCKSKHGIRCWTGRMWICFPWHWFNTRLVNFFWFVSLFISQTKTGLSVGFWVGGSIQKVGGYFYFISPISCSELTY